MAEGGISWVQSYTVLSGSYLQKLLKEQETDNYLRVPSLHLVYFEVRNFYCANNLSFYDGIVDSGYQFFKCILNWLIFYSWRMYIPT